MRSHWGSRMAFVLAASGSAVGLGNIWKFPYITGVNGGGSFVLVYLACIALVGIPIFMAELYIGQQGQSDSVHSFEKLHKKGTFWTIPGWLGLLSAGLIMSFYSVVGGWVLDFEFKSLLFQFANMNEAEIKGQLNGLLASPARQVLMHTIFFGLTTAIVYKGVKEGLERWSKILMPALLVMLLGLFFYSFSLEGFGKAINFLFSPKNEALSPGALLEAVGHSFFTLSLGMGVILTYGSYLNKEVNLPRVAITVAFLDTAIALLAGVVIFSVVFSFGLEPGSGPGLIFSTLPALFTKLPGGNILMIIFFLLITFAAITSAVSILEVVVARLSDHYKVSRRKATLVTSAAIYVLGLLSAFSYNLLNDVKVFNLHFFDLFDTLTSSYLLPLGGLFISLFFGWVLGPKAAKAAMGGKEGPWAWALLWLTRIIAPFAILLVFYNKVIGF